MIGSVFFSCCVLGVVKLEEQMERCAKASGVPITAVSRENIDGGGSSFSGESRKPSQLLTPIAVFHSVAVLQWL